jgi:hypothetical protein
MLTTVKLNPSSIQKLKLFTYLFSFLYMKKIMGNDSGAAKRNKKRRLEAMALSQKGALDKFIVRDSQVNSENQASDDNIGDDTVEADAPFADAHIVDDAVIGDQSVHPNIDDDPNIGNEGNDTNVADDINNSSHPDIFDPRTWDGLDKKND